MVQELSSREKWFVDKMNCTFLELGRLREVDPTGRSWAWALKGVREGWMSSVKTSEFQRVLVDFQKLKHSPKFCETFSTDLNRYNDFTALVEALNQGRQLKSNKQRAREYEGASLLGAEGGWALYRVEGIDNFQVLKLLSSGTSWCTAQEEQAKSYLEHALPIYNARFMDEPVCQIDPRSGQFHDTSNKTILVGRVLMDGELGTFLLRYADEQLLAYFKKLRLIVVEKCSGPGAAYLSLQERMDADSEMAMLAEVPQYQAMRYASKFFKTPSRDLDIQLANTNIPLGILEYYSCEVRDTPWNREVDHEARALNILRSRPASIAKYLARYFDLTTYEFEDHNQAEAWMGTNPQIHNIHLIKKVEDFKWNGHNKNPFSLNHIGYYSRTTKKHASDCYLALAKHGEWSNLTQMLKLEATQNLPPMDDEACSSLVISLIRHQNRCNGTWGCLLTPTLIGHPVLLHYTLQCLSDESIRDFRAEGCQVLEHAMKTPELRESVEPVLRDLAQEGDTFAVATVVAYCKDMEFLDTLMESLTRRGKVNRGTLMTHTKRRTLENYTRQWSPNTAVAISKLSYRAWQEYLKTAKVSEGTKFLIDVTRDNVAVIKKLIQVKTLTELGVTLEQVVHELYGDYPMLQHSSKDHQVIGGILKRKFGWKMPLPQDQTDPEMLVRFYYYTGQEEVLLGKLDLVRTWSPKEIAYFMSHMKGEWKGTEIARRLVGYKKGIQNNFPRYNLDYQTFWAYADSGLTPLTPVKGGSHLADLLYSLGLQQA